MKNRRLPIRLEHDLIVEAVFEMRFSFPEPETAQQVVASQIMTKLLQIHMGKTGLEDVQPIVRRNDMAMVPMDIRMQDPSLKYAPLFILENIKDYKVAFGDHMLAIVHNMPYKGWEKFKEQIIHIISKTSSILIKEKISIERFSLRYVDHIHDGIEKSFSELLNVNMHIDERNLLETPLNLRTENYEDDIVILQEIISPVHFKSAPNLNGMIIATDTVQIVNKPYNDFSDQLMQKLEKMHEINKKYFFQTLTIQAEEKLGAEYE